MSEPAEEMDAETPAGTETGAGASVEEAVHEALERQLEAALSRRPEMVANAVFPLLGPIIRRTVTDSLNGMLRSFNETLKYSISIRGLFWRLEAMRTGRSFSDVVLSKTMEFQVEQVFLIHSETGLMLHHVSDSTSEQDPMMISGMLTAIQDFVQSSLGSADGEALDTLNVGDTTILIERGPHAFLAAVARGTIPPGLKQTLAESLGQIHKTYGHDLEHFSGDTEPIEPAKSIVEECLVRELKEAEKKFPVKLVVIWTVILALTGRWTYVTVRDGIYWSNYIAQLNQERGIVVVTAKKDDGKYHVWGLRDSYAADPVSLLKHSKLAFEKVDWRWEPYHSTLPEFVLQRNVDKLVVRFEKGTDTIVPADMHKIDEAAVNLLKLAEHLSQGHRYFEAIVYGHTNETEDGDAATRLGQLRADAVYELLKQRGLEELKIEPKGIGFQRPVRRQVKTEFDEAFNRSVTFRIKVRKFEDDG